MRSITLIPFEIFDDIWYTHISGRDDMSRVRTVVPPCCLFDLYTLNYLKNGQLVHSITP